MMALTSELSSTVARIRSRKGFYWKYIMYWEMLSCCDRQNHFANLAASLNSEDKKEPLIKATSGGWSSH